MVRVSSCSGVVLPSSLDAADNLPAWPPAVEASRVLSQLTVGQTVGLATLSKFPDRYGRHHAQAFIERENQSIWLQAYLIGLGQARVDVANLAERCADDLLRLEAEARKAKLGIWKHAAYHIRDAAKPRDLLRARGSFQVVRGTVRKVAVLRSTIFINFGKDYRRDFTAGVSKKTLETKVQRQTIS